MASFYNPVYWHTWLGLGILRTIQLLPWRLQRMAARALGTTCFYLLPIRRLVVLVNLRICFPELSESERRRIARRHYQSLALGIIETAHAWWQKPEKLPPYRLEGLENLEQAKAKGRGVLLVSGHFTTLEITGRMLCLNTRISCLYRNPNNPLLAKFIRDHRISWTNLAIPMADLKGLMHALRAGEVVWYAPDQGKVSAQTQLLPFFGEPAVTNTATSRLAKMSGASVVPFYPERQNDGTYVLRILPALEDFPSDDEAADTLRIVSQLEKAIRVAPEQYLWVHRRFKKRKGLPRVYPRSRTSE